jgi:hypothetical protein
MLASYRWPAGTLDLADLRRTQLEGGDEKARRRTDSSKATLERNERRHEHGGQGRNYAGSALERAASTQPLEGALIRRRGGVSADAR